LKISSFGLTFQPAACKCFLWSLLQLVEVSQWLAHCVDIELEGNSRHRPLNGGRVEWCHANCECLNLICTKFIFIPSKKKPCKSNETIWICPCGIAKIGSNTSLAKPIRVDAEFSV
jgi:hypothetical protein